MSECEDKLELNSSVLVSAVITTHNRLECLKRAYKSVKDQTYSSIEIIIVDDASTDGTENWISNLRDRNLRYIKISESDSSGANHARNVGICASRGMYLAFLDDDDYWFPQKLSLQVLVAEKGYDIISGLWCVEGSPGRWYQVSTDERDWELSNLLRACRGGATSVPLLRKSSVIRSGMFDERVVKGQDHDLWIRMIRDGCREKTIQKNLVKYYYSENSTYRSCKKLLECTEYKLQKYSELYEKDIDAAVFLLNDVSYALIRHYLKPLLALRYKLRALRRSPTSFENLYFWNKVRDQFSRGRLWRSLPEEPW